MCTLTMPLDMEIVRGPPGALFPGHPPHLLGGPPFRMGPLHQPANIPLVDDSADNIVKTLPRPCLVMSEAQRPRGNKRVVFADACGLALTHVKVMTEPSCAPPKWTAAFLAQVTQGASVTEEEEQWDADFSQPAADYMALRQATQKQSVALESAAVKPVEKALVGTIKVKNLSFEKEVFVRVTFDSWASQQDVFATYVQTGLLGSSGTSLLDTFTFHTALPPTLHRIEFCVGYRCSDHEFWDNNNGKNYVFRKKKSGVSDVNEQPIQNGRNGGVHYDALRLQLNSWTEFAAWHHLVTDGPYW